MRELLCQYFGRLEAIFGQDSYGISGNYALKVQKTRKIVLLSFLDQLKYPIRSQNSGQNIRVGNTHRDMRQSAVFSRGCGYCTADCFVPKPHKYIERN